jgi:hypothetical protein
VLLRKKQANCIACGGNERLDILTYDYAKYGVCSKNPVPEVPQITWQNYVEKYSNA